MNKAQILQEIKRTAESNGRIPLGRNRFEIETGIKEWDWQKFWPRWSDAVREAGFAPNKFVTAFDRTQILLKFAQLACELRRIPTRGDLRFKRNNDSDFPTDGVFERLGSRVELVKQLQDYCRNHDEFEDVVGLCEKYSPRNRSIVGNNESVNGETGFVYLIKSGRFHKIGRANSVGRREYEIALQLPEKATTVHAIRTDDPNGIEAYWHNRFARKRKNGEWFDLSGEDVAAFKSRKFM